MAVMFVCFTLIISNKDYLFEATYYHAVCKMGRIQVEPLLMAPYLAQKYWTRLKVTCYEKTLAYYGAESITDVKSRRVAALGPVS